MGRSSKCDLHIADDSVSREHAEIRVTRGGAIILDLESTNGISVNGSSVQTHQLSSGDCIQLGSHVFRFLADDDLESQYHATVYAMMTRDGLTGAYNKRYLEETLDREVARCRRHCRPLAVIMADIDHFKSVNDSYGHVVGDQVLREVSRRLQEILRRDDVLARFGGEEFTIVMVEAGPEDAVEIAERCREAIQSKSIQTTVGSIPITISLGVTAPRPEDLGSSHELIVEADERMYEAKRAGRNRTVC
jgi:diguanylate cyclase (GGDEF)-like protein